MLERKIKVKIDLTIAKLIRKKKYLIDVLDKVNFINAEKNRCAFIIQTAA